MNKSEYQKYLASREWALKKEAVRGRSGSVCERCGTNPYELTHHLTYERIGNEDMADLLGVCEACHLFLSGKSDYDPQRIDKEAKSLAKTSDPEDTAWVLVNVYNFDTVAHWGGTFNDPTNSDYPLLKEAITAVAHHFAEKNEDVKWLSDFKCGSLPGFLETTLWVGREVSTESFGYLVLVASRTELKHWAESPEIIVTIGEASNYDPWVVKIKGDLTDLLE